MSSALCRQAMLEVIDMIECNRESQAEIDMIYSCFREKVINEMNLNIPFKDVNLNIKKRYKPRKGFWNEELTGLWNDMKQKDKEMRRCSNRNAKRDKHRIFRVAQHKFDKKFRFF